MVENISWKQMIKKMQIIFFIFIIFAYFIFNYFSDKYNKYTNTKTQLENIKITQTLEKQDLLTKLKEKKSLLEKVFQNKTNYNNFVKGYNICYPKYIDRKYGLENIKISSLSNCLNKYMSDNIGTNYDNFVKELKDQDIVKLAMSLGIKKNKLTKFNFDQKLFLRSLDQHIFNGGLEDEVDVITFGQPVVLDQKLNLYKVGFSFAFETDYNKFIKILSNMQNEIAGLNYNNLYYTISSVSSFDLSNEKNNQKITIQGNFYFTK